MEINELKQKIRQTLTQNPDKKITPAELEDVMIDMVDNQPSQESVIKKELFFDDGSGEVVPVKHPDLSTQPSILPYKFAGNYVYEQMVWVDGEKFSDYNIGEIDLIKFQDYELDIKSTILIGHHVFIVGEEYYGNYTPLPYDVNLCFNIASNDKRIFLKRNGPTSFKCKGVWVRVVWTAEPNAGEYYYAPESKYNLYINAPQDCTFSFADNTFNMIEGKVPDSIVERFITEDHVPISIQHKDSSQRKRYTILCPETSEAHSYTTSSPLIFVYVDETYGGVASLEHSFPQAAERLKKGEKTTLNVNIDYV